MRRSFVLFIALGLVLTACGTLEISLAKPERTMPAGYVQALS